MSVNLNSDQCGSSSVNEAVLCAVRRVRFGSSVSLMIVICFL